MAAPRPSTPHALESLATLEAFENLGIAVFPEKLGRKGTRIKGWPLMPVSEAHAITKVRASGIEDINVAGRAGQGVAVLDLDAKNGVDPDRMLPLLRSRLEPAIVAIVKTRRGYHIWVAVERSVCDGYCSAIGGEVYSEPHLAMLPPSLHPSGHKYTWVVEPRRPEGKADLAAFGLVPDEPSASRGGSKSHDSAPPEVQAEFEALMGDVGVRRGRGAQDLVLCAWHEDRAPSLSINWEKALFHCFGAACEVRGGIGSLRKLVAHTPSYRQEQRWLPTGDKLGCVDGDVERLAAALERLGQPDKGQATRDCKKVFAVGRCTRCPTNPAFPLSCGMMLCLRCMPGRFAADWQRHVGALPQRLSFIRLRPRDLWGLSPVGMLKRARNRFREWRNRSGVHAGIYGLRLDARVGAVFLLAIPAEDPVPLSTRAFDVEVLATDQPPESCLRWFQAEYEEEARSWKTDEELMLLIGEIKGRRRFQGFGGVYAPESEPEQAPSDPGESDVQKPVAIPLGRVSGGSNRGAGKREARLCPSCGARVEMYDFKVRLEEVQQVGNHWRWSGPRPRSRAAA